MTRAEELLPRFLTDHLALTRRQAEADRLIGASLAGHLVHDLPGADGEDPAETGRGASTRSPSSSMATCSTPWPPPSPSACRRWRRCSTTSTGPGRPCATGWVPAEALSSSPRYRLAAVGAPPPPRWLTTYAVDVVALADGSWRVVQDLADTPTGVGYALHRSGRHGARRR